MEEEIQRRHAGLKAHYKASAFSETQVEQALTELGSSSPELTLHMRST